MRLIATLQNQQLAQDLSSYLKKQGIENELDLNANTDWGSQEYGTVTARLWSIDEDQFNTALNIAHEFIANPNDPKFKSNEKGFANLFEPAQETLKESQTKWMRGPKKVILRPEPMGIITLYFLIGCCILFLFTEMLAPTVKNPPPSIPYIPVYYSQLKKDLLFDYPKPFEIIDKLINAFGLEKLQNINDLPPEGKTLLETFYLTPYWKGLYGQIVEHFQNSHLPWRFDTPMFEKIQQGEWWRLFSPCLLHSDIFHLLFNMIWLAVLGKQMEKRLKSFRYLFFILLTGIITNVAQYLMSGSNFLGFSGILCAMLTFIWVRQKKAPWEGYLLQNSTMGFIMFFLFTVLLIQVASFYTEVYFGQTLSPYIANTAHMTGLACGWILGRLNFFAWRS